MDSQKDDLFRIFLIDDDEDEHLLFREAIGEITPVSIMTALNSCEKLIDHLIVKGQEPPDLIFLDINMPRMNGIECLQQLRKAAKLNDMLIVMYTNSLRTEDIITCYKHGANIYVTKPFSFQDEVILIKKILTFYKRQLSNGSPAENGDVMAKNN